MNLKTKIRKLILVLAIIASFVCSSFCIMWINDRYSEARHKLNVSIEAAEGWEACRLMKPEFYQANTETASLSLKNVNQAKKDFWVRLSKTQLIGVYLAAGSLGAITGFLTVWIILLYSSMAVYGLFHWLYVSLLNRTGQSAKHLNVQNPQ
jgi:hypothetical protein